MLNIWGLVIPIEAQVWFWIYICLHTLLDSISWTKIDTTCVKQKDLFDNVNLSNPDTVPLVFIKRTDAYNVNVNACKL